MSESLKNSQLRPLNSEFPEPKRDKWRDELVVIPTQMAREIRVVQERQSDLRRHVHPIDIRMVLRNCKLDQVIV